MKYHIHKKISSARVYDYYLGRIDGAAGFKRPCKFKFLKTKKSDNPAFLDILLHEVKVGAALRHKNILNVVDVVEMNGLYGIVTDADPGVSLEELLWELRQNNSKIAVAAAIYICSEVATALHFAHSCVDPVTQANLNIIHCAVSPENIFITETGDVKLGEFGEALSRLKQTETQSSNLMTKFNYISPEQRYGVKLTYSVDNFALGVILWECIAGRQRFEDFELSLNDDNDQLDPEVPPLTEIVPDISPELSEIVMRATTINPEERYKSSGAFAAILNSYLRKIAPDFGPEKLTMILKRTMKKRLEYFHAEIQAALNESIHSEQKVNAIKFEDVYNEGDQGVQLYRRGKDLSSPQNEIASQDILKNKSLEQNRKFPNDPSNLSSPNGVAAVDLRQINTLQRTGNLTPSDAILIRKESAPGHRNRNILTLLLIIAGILVAFYLYTKPH